MLERRCAVSSEIGERRIIVNDPNATEPIKHFEVSGYCGNCGFRGTIAMPKGKALRADRQQPCPHCECNSMFIEYVVGNTYTVEVKCSQCMYQGLMMVGRGRSATSCRCPHCAMAGNDRLTVLQPAVRVRGSVGTISGTTNRNNDVFEADLPRTQWANPPQVRNTTQPQVDVVDPTVTDIDLTAAGGLSAYNRATGPTTPAVPTENSNVAVPRTDGSTLADTTQVLTLDDMRMLVATAEASPLHEVLIPEGDDRLLNFRDARAAPTLPGTTVPPLGRPFGNVLSR